MERSRSIFGALCVVPLLLQFAFYCFSSAQAEIPDNAPDLAKGALLDLQNISAATKDAGSLPRYSDPAAKALYDRLWDANTLLGEAPRTRARLQHALAVFEITKNTCKGFFTFSKPGTQPNLALNAQTYREEISRCFAFQLDAHAALLEAMSDFWIHLPEDQKNETRKNAVVGLREALKVTFAGLFVWVSDPSLTSAERFRVTYKMSQTAPRLQQHLTLEQRAELFNAAIYTSTGEDLTAKGYLNAVAGALAQKDCTSLCAAR